MQDAMQADAACMQDAARRANVYAARSHADATRMRMWICSIWAFKLENEIWIYSAQLGINARLDGDWSKMNIVGSNWEWEMV